MYHFRKGICSIPLPRLLIRKDNHSRQLFQQQPFTTFNSNNLTGILTLLLSYLVVQNMVLYQPWPFSRVYFWRQLIINGIRIQPNHLSVKRKVNSHRKNKSNKAKPGLPEEPWSSGQSGCL